ncbi:MAG: Crp/Fnr family transcriptional regulator [Pedobacter sp.]|nr:MAG: Crp/Fnr family transcriptional regulator [Pedobacter sp.]
MDNLDGLREAVVNIVSFTDEEWAKITQAFAVKEVPAKFLLTDISVVERKLYYIVQGVARLYCIDTKGNQATIFIFKEGNFATSYDSFLSQSPSQQALETLDNCKLLVIDKSNFEKLHQEIPKMNILTRFIADQRFINAQRIFTSHIMHSPEVRYLAFERDHGDLLLRIPHQIIASFLGITPVSLSRIRKRVLRK